MWNLKKEQKKNREQNGDYQRLGCGEKLEILIEAYKLTVISKFLRCNIQHGDYSSSQYGTAYLKVGKRVNLKSSHHNKKWPNSVNHLSPLAVQAPFELLPDGTLHLTVLTCLPATTPRATCRETSSILELTFDELLHTLADVYQMLPPLGSFPRSSW